MLSAERIYCPIRCTIWTPDNDSMLDYDWEPAKPAPRIHFPNRVRAHRQGIRIAREELAYLRQRLDVVGEEIQAERNLMAFWQEFDSLQAKVRVALGVNDMSRPGVARQP